MENCGGEMIAAEARLEWVYKGLESKNKDLWHGLVLFLSPDGTAKIDFRFQSSAAIF